MRGGDTIHEMGDYIKESKWEETRFLANRWACILGGWFGEGSRAGTARYVLSVSLTPLAGIKTLCSRLVKSIQEAIDKQKTKN